MRNFLKKINYKTLTTVFTTISVLTWWHVPIDAVIFSLINIIIILIKRSYNTHYKVVLIISLITIGLSIWNWDMHIGMRVIEKYMMLRKLRY